MRSSNAPIRIRTHGNDLITTRFNGGRRPIQSPCRRRESNTSARDRAETWPLGTARAGPSRCRGTESGRRPSGSRSTAPEAPARPWRRRRRLSTRASPAARARPSSAGAASSRSGTPPTASPRRPPLRPSPPPPSGRGRGSDFPARGRDFRFGFLLRDGKISGRFRFASFGPGFAPPSRYD